MTDYRSTALIVENADGSTACDLRYRSHHIFNGKYKIPGLPAVYADETESQTLEIVMEDAVTGVEVTLQYGVLPDYDVITRSFIAAKERYVSGKRSLHVWILFRGNMIF